MHWPFSSERNSSRILEILLRLIVLALALLCIGSMPAWACGPDFPNYILDDGMKDLLLAPVANFARELERLQLRTPAFRAVQTTNESFATDSAEAELGELRAALRKSGIASDETKALIARHRETRNKLADYIAELQRFDRRPRSHWVEGKGDVPTDDVPPPLPEIEVTTGLPAEFANYLRGAIVWHDPAISNKSVARFAWEKVLALPESERRYKSTWSAFMLGRFWAEDEPEKAREYFQRVRELARKGFSDPLGLAAASIGLEAKTFYEHTNFARATELYLEQYATGDSSAVNSLLTVIDDALRHGDAAELGRMATNALSCRVVTAYLISRGSYYFDSEHSDFESGMPSARAWLKAVERAGVQDMASAEVIALAAYRAGDFDAAQRWINLAKASPTAQWLQAKLLLRAGKLDKAGALLAKVSQSFPTAVALTNPPATLAENLFAPGRTRLDYTDTDTAAGREVLAEIGALKLARREFVASLDALLNAGFWMDAAYVAERVLTTDELKSYVDDRWPTLSPAATSDEANSESSRLRTEMTSSIRYLLGRRLTREKRGHEAREYYPAEWQPKFDQLIAALQGGQDETLPAVVRARQLFAAAIIARTNGLELVGTEVSPDWRVYDGDFEGSLTIETRTNESFGIVRASELEMERALKSVTDPDERFHYRWQATYLGWAAAQLLPDNSDETALVLCRAGSWLKNRDLKVADVFYKALVNRCRKTPLGREADRIRWFPRLDEEGHWVPRPPMSPPAKQDESNESAAKISTEIRTVSGVPTIASSTGGFREYVVQSGDTVLSIARGCNKAGLPITVQGILEANPEVFGGRLFVGQLLRIPHEKQSNE